MQDLIKALEQLVDNPQLLAELPEEERVALLRAAGRLSRPSRDEIRVRHREKHLLKHRKQAQQDRELRSQTGIRQARRNTVFVAPKQISFSEIKSEEKGEAPTKDKQFYSSARPCYACNVDFTEIHFFYDALCPACGDLNYQKRFQTASLEGRTALITGARLKIGYHATLLMLRAGARVIATTRFPVDAASRFTKEEDYAQWRDRLEIFGLDLRHTPSVEFFAQYLQRHLDRLDIIIHNAAQTVRRPPAFYAHLMKQELTSMGHLPSEYQRLLKSYEECKNILVENFTATSSPALTPNPTPNIDQEFLPMLHQSVMSLDSFQKKEVSAKGMGILASAQLSQVPYASESVALKSEDWEKIFPKNKLDVDLQQVDLRETNSWRYKIDDVPTPELLEVQLVNAIAPFVLTSKLLPLMKRDYTGEKHIVNVTAMEGKFYRFKKSERHPHTNMAKAALNMLTHTSASDLARFGIYMNAVDTGWVTDENPADQVEKVQTVHDFQPPLDIVDGAARICDPFFLGISTGHHWCGKFLKDYHPIEW